MTRARTAARLSTTLTAPGETARLDRLEREVAAALEDRQRRRDPVNDAQLLSGIAGACGDAVFSAADLRGSSDPILRAVLDGLTGGRSARG